MVTLHIWTLVGVSVVRDLRKRFLVVKFHAWALVGLAGIWI